MNDRNTSYAFSGSYRPWGHVRRRNTMARVIHTVLMSVLGLAVLAGLVLLAVFASAIAVVAIAALSLAGVCAALMRRPAQVHVSTQDQNQKMGKGIYVARKSGSTWTVY